MKQHSPSFLRPAVVLMLSALVGCGERPSPGDTDGGSPGDSGPITDGGSGDAGPSTPTIHFFLVIHSGEGRDGIEDLQALQTAIATPGAFSRDPRILYQTIDTIEAQR